MALIDELEQELEIASGADSLSVEFARANYNLHYAESDASRGVHNYKYAKKLLEDSINDFTPTP